MLTVSHAQIQSLGKTRAAAILRHFKREIDLPIAAIVAFHTVAHTVGASVSGAIYVDVFGENTLWVFSLVFTLLVLVFSEILPKTLGVIFVKEFAVPVAYGVRGLVFVLRPLLWLTNMFARLLRRGGQAPITSMEEIRLLVAFGRSEGVLGTRVADMIEGAARLRELTAYDVMVPRALVVFLSGEQTLEQNLARDPQDGSQPLSRTRPTAISTASKGVVLVKELLFRLRDTETVEPRRDRCGR